MYVLVGCMYGIKFLNYVATHACVWSKSCRKAQTIAV